MEKVKPNRLYYVELSSSDGKEKLEGILFTCEKTKGVPKKAIVFCKRDRIAQEVIIRDIPDLNVLYEIEKEPWTLFKPSLKMSKSISESILNRFGKGKIGQTNHSGRGETLGIVLEHLQKEGIPYRLECLPRAGYSVEQIPHPLDASWNEPFEEKDRIRNEFITAVLIHRKKILIRNGSEDWTTSSTTIELKGEVVQFQTSWDDKSPFLREKNLVDFYKWVETLPFSDFEIIE